MQDYDPENPPDPEAWLALAPEERRQLVADHYERAGGYGGSLEVHARVHALIETQLARQVTPVKAAFMRLRDNGLDREEAVRAIGSVLARRIRRIDDPEDLTSPANREYFSALETLTADTWFAGQAAERGR